LLSGAEIQQQLADAEKRYEKARDNADVEARKARDEERKRKRAEARIGMSLRRSLLTRLAELEGQLALRSQELDAVKDGGAKDAQELLANAKDRLADLHAEVSRVDKSSSDCLAVRNVRNARSIRITRVPTRSRRPSRE
jgi:hypothetical protein